MGMKYAVREFNEPETALIVCRWFPYSTLAALPNGKYGVGREVGNGEWSLLRNNGDMMFGDKELAK
jgi:hypothetical protein